MYIQESPFFYPLFKIFIENHHTTMAAPPRELNPHAAIYIPISHIPTSHSHFSNFHFPLHPIFPSPQPPYFPPFSPQLYTHQLYTTSYPIQPTNSFHHLPPPAVAPPPSPVAQYTPLVTTTEKAEVVQEVLPECLRRRTERRGQGGKKEGFGGNEREGKKEDIREKVGQNRYCGKVGSKFLPKKTPQEVLPLKHDEEKTTVMIKNIPNKYTRALLLKFLDNHCMAENQRVKDVVSTEAEENTVSSFDFMYLPMDFGTRVNRGYAFVNFTNARAVWKFYKAFHRKAWDFFDSPKITEIVCAKIQGKEALVNHFEKCRFACESDEFLPVCFIPARDGLGEPVTQSTVGQRIATPGNWGTQNHQI